MQLFIESNVSAPREEYTRRLEARRARRDRLRRQYARVARTRNFLLGAMVFQILLTEKETAQVFCTLLLPPALLFVGLVLWRHRLLRAIRRVGAAVEYYQRRLACVTDQWIGRGEAELSYVDERHPCATDLDLFGAGSPFEMLCPPCTPWGRDTLAAWLSCPAEIDEIRARQAAIAESRPLLDLREELAVLAREIPEPNDLAALSRTEIDHEPPDAPAAIASALMLSLCCAALFVVSWGSGLAPAAFVAALLLERGLGWTLRRGSPRTLADYISQGRGLRSLSALLACVQRLPFSRGRLSPARAALPALTLLRWLLAMAPYAPLLLWGTPVLLALEKWRRIRGPVLERWLHVLGECEALSALAAHAYENPADVFPEIVPEGVCFEAEQLGHPLLPKANCVRNDVRLNAGMRLLVVSGSNMSGKSTFLRTVGINAVLALAGAPVRARRLRITPLVVGATLRVQDSLQTGRSRFYAEVLRVRQLLDLTKRRPPLLFLLDELFQGTNSEDRRAGAEGVLRMLVDSGAIGLVTTHDLALTDIAERMGSIAANVHFEDQLENGALSFDYLLRPGVVRSRNGLALMRAVGIDI